MSRRIGPTPQEIEYQLEYGGLPQSREALLEYARKEYPFTQKQFDEAMERLNRLEWNTVDFTIPLVPKPTPRPRTDGNHFYVKGAAENKRAIKHFIEKNIIATRVIASIFCYLPIPKSQLNNAEIYLAEAGLIVPVTMGDVDNFMKTYLDMITGHLILNDNLVSEGWVQKRYSLRPHLDVILEYQNGYDCRYNEKRITRSKGYAQYEPSIIPPEPLLP